MLVEDTWIDLMKMITGGGMDKFYICGEEKRNEKGIVGLVDANGREHTECVCYDCMEKIPTAATE